MWGEGSKEERHISIVNLESGEVQAVPGSETLHAVRWSPDGHRLSAMTQDAHSPIIYSFFMGKWAELWPKQLGCQHWSKDSRFLYRITGPDSGLMRFEVATGRVLEVRKVREFAITGTLYSCPFWTSEEEPVALKNLNLNQIYRIDRER